MGRAKPVANRFIDHVQELRKRLMLAVLALAFGSAVGYALLDHLISLLGKPFGHTLYYTAPTGQFSFIIKVCILFGIIAAAPVIMYQVARFLEPLFQKKVKFRILRYTIAAILLAAGGILFAYYLSLPLTLQFLTTEQEGTSGIIAPLISADEYFNFVMAYIGGFALLFQIPLIVFIINSIHPLNPSGFFKSLRYVVLVSFIAAAIITPTPDPINQAVMAGPIIVLYSISCMLVLMGRGIARKPSSAPATGAIQPRPRYEQQLVPQMDVTEAMPSILAEFAASQQETDQVSTELSPTQEPALTATMAPAAASVQVATTPPNPPRRQRSIDGFMPWQTQQQRKPLAVNRPAQQRTVHANNSRQMLISDFHPASS